MKSFADRHINMSFRVKEPTKKFSRECGCNLEESLELLMQESCQLAAGVFHDVHRKSVRPMSDKDFVLLRTRE